MINKRFNALEILSKLLVFFVLLSIPVAQAVDLDQTITPEQQAQFDQMLVPIMKIYTFIKYAASVIAVIALLFAGISYMFSAEDIRKKETSKSMAAYVLIGLAIIWAAPVTVKMLLG